MKTKIRKNVLVAFLLGTLICYANGNVNSFYRVEKDGNKEALLPAKKRNVFKIKNEDGVSLYTNNIKNSLGFDKNFDLTSLKDGVYTAELEKANEVEVKKFKVDNHLVTFLGKEKIYKPITRIKGNLLLISKFNFNKAPLFVKIYYNGEEIFSEKVIASEAVLNRIYKLSSIGYYSVEFKVDDRVFKKEFSI